MNLFDFCETHFYHAFCSTVCVQMLIQLEIKLLIKSNWKSNLATLLVKNQSHNGNNNIDIIEYFLSAFHSQKYHV